MFAGYLNLEKIATEYSRLRLGSGEASTSLGESESDLSSTCQSEYLNSPNISLTNLLNSSEYERALEESKVNLSKFYSPCIRCPFLQRARDILLDASNFYEDNLSVVLNERYLIAALLHLPGAIPPIDRNDFGLSDPLHATPLSREQILEEAYTCRTMLDSKCTTLPSDRYKFMSRFGTVMFMLGEKRTAIHTFTEAIQVAIEGGLLGQGESLIPTYPLMLHLLGDRSFEYFSGLVRSAYHEGNQELFDVYKDLATQSAKTKEQKEAIKHFIIQLPSNSRSS